jgi:transposase
MRSDTKDDRNRAVVRYYAEGFSMRETAAHFGVTMQRVHQILKGYDPESIRPAHDTRSNSRGLSSSARSRS